MATRPAAACGRRSPRVPRRSSRPAVANDTYTTLEDTALNVAAPGVLGNDPGAPASVAFHSNPTKGLLVLNADGSLAFTPKPNLNGTDLFTYRGVTGTTATDAALVTVNITPVNDAPVAGDDLYLLDRNVLATGNGNNPERGLHVPGRGSRACSGTTPMSMRARRSRRSTARQ